MKLTEQMIAAVAGAGARLLRFRLPRVPDRRMGRFFRGLERLVYALTGDRTLSGPLAEVADVFETGPPFTLTARKLIAGMEPELVSSALKTLSKSSPYGAA